MDGKDSSALHFTGRRLRLHRRQSLFLFELHHLVEHVDLFAEDRQGLVDASEIISVRYHVCHQAFIHIRHRNALHGSSLEGSDSPPF